MGLSQLQLARYRDALDNFTQADRFDTPAVSRWTWLLGAGLACLFLDRNDEAVAWFERSLAVTRGTGRTHFILAAALQRLGRTPEAREAMDAGLKLLPDSTVRNTTLPSRNTSLSYSARATEIMALANAAGLPAGE